MTEQQKVSKADLHVHSKYSDRPSEWFLRKIGSPESFVEPLALYENVRRRGMDFVTISDHNEIRGALEIAHLPNTFISCEVTTYFPEDGCKIHCLVTGITERWFEDIDRLRVNIYDFRDYLVANNIIYSVAHPLFRVNDRLTIEHFEKLLLLFNRFEGINGSRCHRACQLANVVMENLTPEMISDMAERHKITPLGDTPWKKTLTAGSDDHSGLYAANAYTVTPHAATVMDYLEHLRQGRHWTGGQGGSSLRLAHSFYHIAYSYYCARFMGGASKDASVIGAMLRKMAGERPAPEAGFRAFVSKPLTKLAMSLRKRRLNEVERLLVDEFTAMVDEAENADPLSSGVDQRNFKSACRISHQVSFAFAQRFISEIKKGNLLESLQSISSLGPVMLGIAPYYTSFHTQHKDERFLKQFAAHYPATQHLKNKSGKKLWVTDTFSDVNGVARTINTMASIAHKRGEDLTVLTCQEQEPETECPVINFKPVGVFSLPEYQSQKLVFPPFLEIMEYIERNDFDEIIISTPGPVGLAARAAANVFGLSMKGIYHTDFPGYIAHFTEDTNLQGMTERYMLWFYGEMEKIYVSSDHYRAQMVDMGFDPAKLDDLPHGVDLNQFNPSHRSPDFFDKYGVNGSFKYIYVGRVSKEKNLEAMLEGFKGMANQGEAADLIVVGDGPHYEELKKRYQSEHIVFTGYLTGDDLARAYASADVFVFPSMTDTFGNAVLEALASGLPTIVSDKGGPPEIVRRQAAGLVVDARRPQALADAMLKLKTDKQLHADMVKRALATAQTSTWEHAVDLMLKKS